MTFVKLTLSDGAHNVLWIRMSSKGWLRVDRGGAWHATTQNEDFAEYFDEDPSWARMQ